MTIYMTVDENGLPTGFYDSNAYGARGLRDDPDTVIPIEAIEITAKQHVELLENQGTKRWNAGTGRINKFDRPGPTNDDLWAALRNERNARLSASDWTQMPDAPVDRAAWAAYRQALRDLPDNTTDPARPIWPTPVSA